MARWLKHENKFIMYLIMKKKKKEKIMIINQSVYVWDMRY